MTALPCDAPRAVIPVRVRVRVRMRAADAPAPDEGCNLAISALSEGDTLVHATR